MINDTAEKNTLLEIFRILFRRIYIVILCTVLGVIGGVGLILLRDKPVYTATQTVMFVANLSESSAPSNDVTLSKLYLQDVASHIVTPIFIRSANEIYTENGGQGNIKASSVKVNFDSEARSLIFTISYSDANQSYAEKKLNAVIESANKNLDGKIMAQRPELKVLQSSASMSVHTQKAKYLAICTFIGLALGVAIVFIIHFTDNTVKDKDEFEQITGANFLSYIEQQEE